jgi:hypothetical protein
MSCFRAFGQKPLLCALNQRQLRGQSRHYSWLMRFPTKLVFYPSGIGVPATANGRLLLTMRCILLELGQGSQVAPQRGGLRNLDRYP